MTTDGSADLTSDAGRDDGAAATSTGGRPLPVWLFSIVVGVFGLFYAYAVWSAVAFLVQQASGDAGLTTYGWFALIMPIVFPAVVFGGAVVISRRGGFLRAVFLLLLGLAIVAVFWLNVFALAVTSDSIYNAV